MARAREFEVAQTSVCDSLTILMRESRRDEIFIAADRRLRRQAPSGATPSCAAHKWAQKIPGRAAFYKYFVPTGLGSRHSTISDPNVVRSNAEGVATYAGDARRRSHNPFGVAPNVSLFPRLAPTRRDKPGLKDSTPSA